MADETNPANTTPPEKGFPDVAANNDEVSRKLADQGVEGHTAPDILASAGSELDKIAAIVKKEHDEPPEVAEVKETPVVKVKADVVEIPVVTTPDPAAEAKAASDKVLADRATELFKDSPTLPQGASPKSSEAFSQVKIRAAQEISALETEREKLRAENKALIEAAKTPLSLEIETELKELREWRAKLDVDANPKFAEFDKKVVAIQEFIYSQLRKSPAITEDVIAQIRKHGGPEAVNMSKIFDAIKDPVLQKVVESKLADIEMDKYNKEMAIKEAKSNIGKYTEERQAEFQKASVAHNETTRKHFAGYAEKMPWYSEKQVAASATPEEKAVVEAHNAFVKTTKTNLDAALLDDSPEMRGIMIVGMGQLLHLQKVHEGYVAKSTAEIAKLTKSLEEASGKLERYTKSSVSRLRESGAAPGKTVAVKKDSDQFTLRASDSLDAIAKDVTEKRALAAAAGA